MDKKLLQDYVDARELVRETEGEIRRLLRKKGTVVQDVVKGSTHDYPYTEQRFKVRGTEFDTKDDNSLRKKERLLEQRRESAEKMWLQVEAWMLGIPARVQRIVMGRYLEGLTWEQVAARMGRRATADSVRMELKRFLEEK